MIIRNDTVRGCGSLGKSHRSGSIGSDLGTISYSSV